MPTLPKNPANVLHATNVSTFGERAVGICNKLKMAKHTRYSFLLPKVSESGASMRGPIPSIITNPVVAPMTDDSSHLRDSAICAIPGVNMEEARGERMAMRAMMPTLVSFLRFCQFFGLSPSPFSKEISWRRSRKCQLLYNLCMFHQVLLSYMVVGGGWGLVAMQKW